MFVSAVVVQDGFAPTVQLHTDGNDAFELFARYVQKGFAVAVHKMGPFGTQCATWYNPSTARVTTADYCTGGAKNWYIADAMYKGGTGIYFAGAMLPH